MAKKIDEKAFAEGVKLGAAAFTAGLRCIPALDLNVAAVIPGKTTGEVADLLSGWHRGWAQANVAAEVE